MSTDIPYVPFDPTEVGPFELVGQKWAQIKRFVDDNTPWVIAGTVVIVVAWWHFELSLPDPPNWFWVAALGGLVATITVWPVSKKVAEALHSPDVVLLSEQDPISGDQQLRWMSSDRFQDMQILNQNGREVTEEYLKNVIINGRMAYEVDTFHEERNVAIASWQAGVSNSEFRRDRAQIKKVKTDLEREANKALEILANNPDVVRQMGADVANDIIRVVEEVENPNGAKLHERMTETLEDAEHSDELLGNDSDEDGHDPERTSNVSEGSEKITIEVGETGGSNGGNGGDGDE